MKLRLKTLIIQAIACELGRLVTTLLSGVRQSGYQSPLSPNKPIISLGPLCRRFSKVNETSKHSLFWQRFHLSQQHQSHEQLVSTSPSSSKPTLLFCHQIPSFNHRWNLPWMMLHIALYDTGTKDIHPNSSILHTPPSLFFGIGTITCVRTSYYTLSMVYSHPWVLCSKVCNTPSKAWSE